MVVNIIRLLQSLDKDGNPDNGITITDTAKNNAVALDFDLSVAAFQTLSEVSSLLSNGGQDVSRSELVSVIEATLHLILSWRCLKTFLVRRLTLKLFLWVLGEGLIQIETLCC